MSPRECDATGVQVAERLGSAGIRLWAAEASTASPSSRGFPIDVQQCYSPLYGFFRFPADVVTGCNKQSGVGGPVKLRDGLTSLVLRPLRISPMATNRVLIPGYALPA